MKIDFINYPNVYMSDGQKLHVNDFEKQPRVGQTVALNEISNKYVPSAYAADNADCATGACPVR